jgi:hypothetical protein
MNMKKVSSSIGLFFLTTVFFAQAMEVAEEEKRKKKTEKPDVKIDLGALSPKRKRMNNNILTVSSRTDRHDNSSGEKRHTPRNFEELSQLIKAKSVFKKSNEEEGAAEQLQPVSILRMRKKISEEDSGNMEIDMQQLKTQRDQYFKSLIEEINDEVYIGPELMAEAALRVHHTKKKNPTKTEKEGYADFRKKRPDEFDEIRDEVLLQMFLMESLKQEKMVTATEEEQESLPEFEPSPKIAFTHASILRKKAKDNEKVTLYLQFFGAIISLLAMGAAFWGSWATAHPNCPACPACPSNGTITG